jgi:hypothetical protein
MLKINDLINNNSHLKDIKIDYLIDEISGFKYAITSCDVKRSFSKYKSV